MALTDDHVIVNGAEFEIPKRIHIPVDDGIPLGETSGAIALGNHIPEGIDSATIAGE